MKTEEIAAALDKAYADKPLSETAKAPISAIKGISEGDAAKMKEAFGIDSVAELAKLKYYEWAREIKTRAAKQ